MSIRPLSLASVEQTKASNLAFALKFLPRQRREDAMVFYRFCRAVDDLADDPNVEEAQKRRGLEAWRLALQSGEGLPPELARVQASCRVPSSLLVAIVEGCEMDICPRPFATMEILRGYCWNVACAVGLVSIRLFGCRAPESEAYAEHLGYALQFTNILRDVGEDAAMGRVYLPLDLLTQFGVSHHSLLLRTPDGDFSGVLKALAVLAESEFQAAQASLKPVDCSALLPAEIMAAFYRRLLAKMGRNHFPVMEQRCHLSKLEKFALAAGVILRCRRVGT